jgi:hypothetical protein
MNRWLLLYTVILFATNIVAYIASFVVPSIWRPRLLQLMRSLSSVGVAVFGATYVCAGTTPGIGWLLIAVATFGSIFTPLRSNTDRRAAEASGPTR